MFKAAKDTPLIHSSYQITDQKAGRNEQRTCWVIHDIEKFIPEQGRAWNKLNSFTCVEYVWFENKKGKDVRHCDERYFISSLAVEASCMLPYIRSHWSIENNLHWQLDVTFGEDKSRLRTLFSPFNMNIARKAALSFLKKDSTNDLELV